jgi:hypothetical protein
MPRFIDKVKLKYHLQKMGINIVNGNYIKKIELDKVIKIASTEESKQKIIKCATKVLTAHGLFTPKTVFYQCRDVCGILAYVFNEIGFDCDVLVAKMKYPKEADWLSKKYKGTSDGHYIFVLDNESYDFTLRQFIPDADFPAQFTIGSPQFKQTYGETRKPYQLGASHVLEFIDYALRSHKNKIIADEIIDMFRKER